MIQCYSLFAVYSGGHLDHPSLAAERAVAVRIAFVVAAGGTRYKFGPEQAAQSALGDMTVYCRWEIRNHLWQAPEGCHC